MMKKSEIVTMPEYFDSYINLVDDINLNEALNTYGPDMFQKEKNNFEQVGDRIYSPGKWTIKDIIQHLIDTERIFAYRALRFARNDDTVLPGFDENYYGNVSQTNDRKLDDLLYEFNCVRLSSIALFNSFNNEMLQRSGICFDKNISVLAIGFVLAGHPLHHFNVIKERYYHLSSKPHVL